MHARIGSGLLLAWLASVAVAQGTPTTNVESASGQAVVKAAREVRVDLGEGVLDVNDLREGLFPEDADSPEKRQQEQACKELLEAGFKCMPPQRVFTRYSLPGVSFSVGSSDLPDLMKRQLAPFADALRGRAATRGTVRIEGHADATGNAQSNLLLSRQRAESVRRYLIDLGVSPEVLGVIGLGSQVLRNPANPGGAENRRVEILREGNTK